MKLGTDVLVHLIYPRPLGLLIAAREYVSRSVGAIPSSAARNKNLAHYAIAWMTLSVASKHGLDKRLLLSLRRVS